MGSCSAPFGAKCFCSRHRCNVVVVETPSKTLLFAGSPLQPFESRNHKLRDIHPDTSSEIFWLQAAGWSLSAWVFAIDNKTGACCDQEPGVCNWPNLRCATVATSIGRKSQTTLQTEYKHNLSVSPDRDDFSVLVANLKKRKAGACAESCSGFARTLDAKEKAKDKHHDIMSLPRILRPSPFCKVVKKGTYQISSNIFKHPNIIQPAVNSLSRRKFVTAWVPQPLCHMFRVLQLHGLQGGQAPLPKLHDLSNCRPSHVVPEMVTAQRWQVRAPWYRLEITMLFHLWTYFSEQPHRKPSFCSALPRTARCNISWSRLNNLIQLSLLSWNRKMERSHVDNTGNPGEWSIWSPSLKRSFGHFQSRSRRMFSGRDCSTSRWRLSSFGASESAWMAGHCGLPCPL